MNSNEYKKYSVLFVDDEIQVLRAIKRGIHLEKYKKYFASSGKEALEIIKREDISVIVTDMKMPVMDGLQLLKKVNDMKPDIVKIILSGYTNTAQIIATINFINIYKFILKPWDLDTELKPLVLEGLRQYDENINNNLNIISATKKNELFKKLVNENKQTFSQIELDFEYVLKLHKMTINYSYLLSMQLKKGNMDGMRIKKEMNFIDVVVSDFIKGLPTKNRNFTISQFSKIIDKKFKKNYYNELKEIYPNFKISSELDESYEFEINFNHMLKLSELILNDFFEIKYDSRIDLLIKISKEKNDTNSVIFVYNIDNNNENFDRIRKNTIYILLNAFADILNGKLKITEGVNSSNIITLEIFNFSK
jgi:CheY-like chemotaxis protein